jgi:hypothetical protein
VNFRCEQSLLAKSKFSIKIQVAASLLVTSLGSPGLLALSFAQKAVLGRLSLFVAQLEKSLGYMGIVKISVFHVHLSFKAEF